MSEDQIKFGGKPRFFNKNKEGGNNSGPPIDAPQRNGNNGNGNAGVNVEAQPFIPKQSSGGGNCK